MNRVCAIYIKIHRDWRLGKSRGRAAYELVQVRFEEHVRLALSTAVGRQVSRATAYNLMARVGRQRFLDYKAGMWYQFCYDAY